MVAGSQRVPATVRLPAAQQGACAAGGDSLGANSKPPLARAAYTPEENISAIIVHVFLFVKPVFCIQGHINVKTIPSRWRMFLLFVCDIHLLNRPLQWSCICQVWLAAWFDMLQEPISRWEDYRAAAD